MYEQLESYIGYLTRKERSRATVNQYRRDISAFIIEMSRAAADGCVTKEAVIKYKMQLCERYRVSSVNTKLAAINGFLEYTGRRDLRVKTYENTTACVLPGRKRS